MKQLKILGIIAGLTFSNLAFANHTVCKKGNEERHVEIVISDIEKGAPCEVKYTKGGQTTTPWSAKTDAEFCKTKATGLIDKIASSGFSCQGDSVQASEAAPTTEAVTTKDAAAQTNAPVVDEKAKRKAEKAEKKAKEKAEKEAKKAQREADKKAEEAKREAAKAEKKAEEAKQDALKKAEAAKKEATEDASKVKSKVETPAVKK